MENRHRPVTVAGYGNFTVISVSRDCQAKNQRVYQYWGFVRPVWWKPVTSVVLSEAEIQHRCRRPFDALTATGKAIRYGTTNGPGNLCCDELALQRYVSLQRLLSLTCGSDVLLTCQVVVWLCTYAEIDLHVHRIFISAAVIGSATRVC